jgi:3-keto steroid reductase
MKTWFTISRLRAHLRKAADYSPWAAKQRKIAKEQGTEYKWENTVARVHFLGVEVDLCDLKSVYALADQLVNGTVGSPDATTMDGRKLPHGSPGTQSFSPDAKQDRWALSQEPGSIGAQRSWGWGLSGIKVPRLDAIILAAGMGGWSDLNWWKAAWTVLFDTVQAVTWPTYKIADVGALVKSQASFTSSKQSDAKTQNMLDNQAKTEEPPLGVVFCSNILGHYILAHELMPLLSQPASKTATSGGKIIQVSSLEGVEDAFSFDDFQGLKSLTPYEGTKRLLDLMALSSELPSVQRAAAPFFDCKNSVTALKSRNREQQQTVKPKVYLTHPGIFASEIFPLPWILVAIYKLVFIVARWMGSPWHPAEAYKAAVAPVWLSLMDNDEAEELEGHGTSKAKWGSATDVSGNERVMKTEVEGWGWTGKIETALDADKRSGRKRGVADVTKESRENFEILGAKCWTKMEEIRKQWEDSLGVRSAKK